jgi:HK97 family phage prohead protease
MELKLKRAYANGVDIENKVVDGYVSTYEWDRTEEKFVKGAWDLKHYLANPVVLWAHQGRNLPIGRAIELREDDKGLFARTQFDAGQTFAMDVFGLFQRGFLNAFSVGFMPKTFVMEPLAEDPNRKGIVWTNAELHEYSAVSVPANPGATVTRDVAEQVSKCLGEGYIEVLNTKSAGDQFFVVPPERVAEIVKSREDKNSLEESLKGIIVLAKAAKGAKVPEQTKTLLLTAHTLFNEMLVESKDEIKPDDLKALAEAVKQFGGVVGNMYPSIKENMDKTISQLDNALKARAA